MSVQDLDKPVHLDDVLERLGAFGRHQVLTMCMLALVYATNSMYNVNYVFAVEDVNYRCKIPSCVSSNSTFNTPWLSTSSPDVSEESIKQCRRYTTEDGCAGFNTSEVVDCDEWVYDVPDSFVAEFGLACQEWKPTMVGTAHNFGSMLGLLVQGQISDRCKIPSCVSSNSTFNTPWLSTSSPDVSEESIKQCRRYTTEDGCAGFNTSEVVDCDEWVYDVPDSFVAEFGLACQEWKPTMVGTAHNFGSMLGLLVQGQISDRFGRKTAAVFAGTMGAVLGLTKSFATSFWFYVILEALEAAIGDALSPMFMLSIEIVEKKKAVLFQMILLNCYTCGLIVMPFISWAVPYWRTFLRVIYAPTLIILTYSFFLDESIRWLFSKGKRDKGIKLIEKIAKRNGVEIDKGILNRLEYTDETTKIVDDKKLLLKTFKSRIMMQRFLVCMVWWLTITLINYGMMISSVFIDGNKYVNFALLMLMDIPSNVFYWLALSKYKRKMPLIVSFLIGGIFCVLQPFVPKGYMWLRLTLIMAFETLATFSYNIVYMYTSELFPTYTRNSMHAICSSVGRLGSLLAPQTPLLISYWSGLPSLIFGLTSLLSGALAVLMPETANTELPDTVEEAERIGKKSLQPLLDKNANGKDIELK